MQARPILVVLKLCALAALVVAGALLAPTPVDVSGLTSGVAAVSAGSTTTVAAVFE